MIDETTTTVERAVETAPHVPAPARIWIEQPAPKVDGGEYPAKRCAGDRVIVEADVFHDRHDLLRALVRYRGPGDTDWREADLRLIDAQRGAMRWRGEFTADRPGLWQYTVEAWTDLFGTWRDELGRRAIAQESGFESELSEGIAMLRAAAAAAARPDDRQLIEHALTIVQDATVADLAKHDAVLAPDLFEAVERTHPRAHTRTLPQPLSIEVERSRARFGSWYELFPRSWGGLQGVRNLIPAFAELGFEVVCLTPVHPIGHTNRTGRDGARVAGPRDPGSPWAIGNDTGGHDAIDAELGTIEDLRALTQAANEHEIDIALEIAAHCSPDHPWVAEHPEWFSRRPDGTLRCSEDPPHRSRDVCDFDWDSPDWRGLWDAQLKIVLAWVDCGVKVFRLDRPHTMPFMFSAWLIQQVRAHHRDVIFQAKPVARPATMRLLAKIGFSQSCTQFIRKASRSELTEHVCELAYSDAREYFRPNFFVNTPDALPEYLQQGGRPAFEARLVLAATLSPSYGIYSGYEHIENVPARDGSEEYLHSEKYEIKERTLDGPLLPLVRRLNEARRANPALQELSNITFLDTRNEAVIAYAKQSPDNTVLTVVNLDPEQPQDSLPTVPSGLGLPPNFIVHDLLSDERYKWQAGHNYVRLEPGVRQAQVMRVDPD